MVVNGLDVLFPIFLLLYQATLKGLIIRSGLKIILDNKSVLSNFNRS
jgi:hypothetical protein